MQGSMFPDLVPEQPEQLVLPPTREAVAVRTGWRLLANRRGVIGWHRTKALGSYDERTTPCGLVGRAVPTPHEWMEPCSVCLEGE